MVWKRLKEEVGRRAGRVGEFKAWEPTGFVMTPEQGRAVFSLELWFASRAAERRWGWKPKPTREQLRLVREVLLAD